jgi:hypothetical protein
MTSRKFGLFVTIPLYIVTVFITKALVMLLQNPLHTLIKAVTSFMDDPFCNIRDFFYK